MKTIKSVTFIIIAMLSIQSLTIAQGVQKTVFEFKPLPYSTDALEPYIDKATMEIHYGKHHKAYFDNFIKAIAGTKMESMTLTDIFKNMSKYPQAVRNNGGGYYNHQLFWENMKANGGVLPASKFTDALNSTFTSLDNFKKLFTDEGKARFGSGWVWLSLDNKGKLFISSTANQDNPLMDIAEQKGVPLLALDVWEHAYYLKYTNRRADYITAFWNVVNWEEVIKRYDAALKMMEKK